MQDVNFINLEHFFYWLYTFGTGLNLISILNRIIEIIVSLRPIALVISLFFIFVAIWSRTRLMKVIEAENEAITVKPISPDSDKAVVNEKWVRLEELINSHNPNDWRIAIFEADVMLDEALDQKGYKSDSLGEKLKSVDPGDLLTLDLAWDAHKVRNMIAHSSSDFQLNEREAKRVFEEYKKVFTELKYI